MKTLINSFDLAAVISGRSFLAPDYNAFRSYSKQYDEIRAKVVNSIPQIIGKSEGEQMTFLKNISSDVTRFAQWVSERCIAGTIKISVISAERETEAIRQIGRDTYGLPEEIEVE